MALKIFKNKGEPGAIPANADNLNYNFQAVLNMVCPVGKVEIFYDNDDHSNYLGFTWERTAIGKAIVGIDISDTDFNTIGKTGGEKTHKLTIKELAEHEHDIHGNTNTYSASGVNYYQTSSIFAGYASGEQKILFYNGFGAEKTGGNQPHNNLQPYQVFAIWKRTA